MDLADDVRYWECIGVLAHEDGTESYRLRAVKDKSGTRVGTEQVVRGKSSAMQLNGVYDRQLNEVPTSGPNRCPECPEAGVNIVRTAEGYIVRACLEHAEEYRIFAHEAGQHSGELFDPNCPACLDDIREGARTRPHRYAPWLFT